MGKYVYLIGAGGHGSVIKEIIEQGNYFVKYFVDNKLNKKKHLGVDIISEEKIIDKNYSCIISIGNNVSRKKVATQRVRNYFNAIHLKSEISPSVTIGIGNVIMAGACINARSYIGNHCIINTNCSVDHDCKVDDFAHISPGVSLGGNVHVGEGAHIGIGSSIKNGIKIGKWSIIGAGASVISDIPEGVVVVGVPAKFLKFIDFNAE